MRKLSCLCHRLALAAFLVAATTVAALANGITVPNDGGNGPQCGNANANSAKFAGNCGALVTVNNGDQTAAYVQENNPSLEAAYRVRLYFNPRLMTMANGDAFDIFAGYDGADPAPGNTSGSAAVRVELQGITPLGNGANKRIMVAVRQDNGSEMTSSSAPLSRGWHSIEFSHTRSTAPGNNNGTLDWWIDGVAEISITGIDNDTEVVNYARWGAVAGLDAGTNGTMRLDDYASQRSGAIGPAVPFGDVPKTHPFWRFIQGAYATEIIPAASVGTFDPNGNITRKEMLKWVLTGRFSSDYVPPACSSATFSDVPCSHPYADWIYDGVAKGITAGCAPGLFCPDGTINRNQMAVFLLTARGVSPASCPPATFADVPSGSPFCPFVNRIAADGITAGCGGGNYCPNDLVSRGQMAVFVQQNFAGFNVTSPLNAP